MGYSITFGGTEEPRENRGSADNLLGFLTCMECGLERCNRWALGSGNKRHVGVRWLEGEDLWNLVHRRREHGDRQGRLLQVFCLDLEERRSDEGFHLVYLFSWPFPAVVFQVNVPCRWRRGYWGE